MDDPFEFAPSSSTPKPSFYQSIKPRGQFVILALTVNKARNHHHKQIILTDATASVEDVTD
jgi:hypothetical protein